MSVTPEELEDRLDDITSMGHTRAKAHIKALYLDLIGEDEDKLNDDANPQETGEEIGRNALRAELRSKVSDV